MRRWLALAACAWPLLLGLAVWQRAEAPSAMSATAVFIVASGICHQIPVRSFHTAGVQWPVCARCAGLYAAAPLGALLALGLLRRREMPRVVHVLTVAALPTAMTMVLEWSALAPIGNLARFIAALPLGAAIAAAIVSAGGSPGPARVTPDARSTGTTG